MRFSDLPAAGSAIALTVLLGALAPAYGADTPIAAKGLTKEQFKALPPTAVLEIKGRTYTVGELRAREARNAAARSSRLAALRPKGRAAFETARSALLAAERARLDGANARLRAQFGAARQALTGASPRPVEVHPPEITEIQGIAEPGAALYVKGRHFGELPGQVFITGLPGGQRTLLLDPGPLFPWTPDGIAVVVPDITGVLDQTVGIVVAPQHGPASPPRSVAFKAAIDVIGAFPNRVVSCGQDATDNACLAYDFFEGTHIEDTFWEEDAVDCDRFEATAKSPWVFDSFSISNDSSDGRIGNPAAVRNGSVYSWQMCWTVNGAGPYSGNHASYVGYLMIRGPKGVPSF
jgi:hypothetical protein